MKVTCLSCQKSYNINDAKIPAGVKTTKCKACGHSMPLKGKTPTKPSADTPVINRSCLYCGQAHALRRDKIPPGTASIKCKSCGRPVALKLGESTETPLVHSLIKEAARPATPTPPTQSAVQPARPADYLTLTCANCNKHYKISSHKIPPTAKTLKCKACGHRIKIPVPVVSPIKQMPTPANLPPSGTPPRKKMGLYAMAAGILLLAVFGAYAGFKIYKDRELNQLTAGTHGQPAASSALLEQEPFLALNLNLPLIIKNIDKRVAKDKKSLKFRTTMALVKSLKLKRLDVFLYAGPENQVLPVILAWGSNARHLEKIFTGHEAFTKYFKPQSSGKYRFKQEALEEAATYSFPDEPYQMTLFDKGAILAPVSVSGAIAADKSLLLNTEIAGFAKSIADPKDLARVALRIPEDLPKGWEKEIQNNPDLVAIPADASRPTFFLQWGQVFTKPLNGETLKYLPENYYEDGWVEAKFID